MPALIDLRKRIKSVRNTQQITQAMKTVATAKFKKAQRVILECRPYWHGTPELLKQVAFWAERSDHPLLAKREERKILGMVLTSDKGLAGAFNSNLLEQTFSFLKKKSEQTEVSLVLIGKKAAAYFKKLSFPILRMYSDQVDKLSPEDKKELAHFLMRLYVLNKTDAIYVAYNEFKSILAPKITITKLLPLEPTERQKDETPLPPDWEPEALPLIDALLPLYVEAQIRHFFSESSAAEHAARMMAMDNATKNADDLASDLMLILNKIRQASITKELLEIMTAVEALAKR